VRKMLIVLAGASLALGSACSDDEPSAYGEETESAWNETCETGGLDEATCGCIYTAITETVPFDEFKQLDEDLQEDPSTPLPAELEAAMTTCITGATTAP
jgi:hypothetical protein